MVSFNSENRELRFSCMSLVWLHGVHKRVPSLPSWERDRERGNQAPSTLSPASLPSRERGVRHVATLDRKDFER
jgi:hypothetical protein